MPRLVRIMSRIGKIPVEIPKGAKVKIDPSAIEVEGPKGKLSLDLPVGVKVEQNDSSLSISRVNDAKQNRANHGTIRAVISNMLKGVTEGHVKELEIQGVGFRGQAQGQKITLNLGFSHPVEFDVPKDVSVKIEKQTEIHLEGVDKCLVGQTAAKIRDLKKPEPYKGKGIRYKGEKVRRKQGKSVKK